MNLIEHIINIAYRLKFGDKRYKYYRQLRRNLGLNRESIVKSQEQAIKELINHAYYNTEYYKELFDSLKLKPEQFNKKEDLKLIPILTKTIIQNNLDKLKSNDKFGKNLIKVTSGGSTGVQAIVYKSKFTEQFYRAAWLRNNSITGWKPSDKTAWIWGSPIEHSKLMSSIFSRLGYKINRRIIFNAYNYSKTDFPNWVNEIIRFRPKVIYGYSSIILEFAKYLIENKIVLPTIERVVSTTEKLVQRETIETAFRCKAYDQYGCREIIAIGVENDQGEMLLTDDVVLLDTNDSNEFLLTALYSFGFPLINYKVGDIGTVKNDDSIQQRIGNIPFPIMNLKIGRITDNFINNKNETISTSALSTYMSTLNLGIKEHQIIQKDFNSFNINYVPLKITDSEVYKEKITKCLEEYFGKKLTIQINEVDIIPKEKSGKRLMFKRDFIIDQKV
ncbi:MAG: phenylacetate--CoA ligase family protein [Bacteroidota bacterium]|nr:MAG: phenylacetate--CoA ligase family protein [Bacteroidota bacterium]